MVWGRDWSDEGISEEHSGGFLVLFWGHRLYQSDTLSDVPLDPTWVNRSATTPGFYQGYPVIVKYSSLEKLSAK